ncbi:hypothetical protein [Mycolicibacterium baixiangningiae]|uniref:hypothetical protein n=1 Tax=Mycolicibacterium baixiangningiae TaxID=2761578 RepID=UPI0018D0DD6D|nr:hypothetical protein [Mycolicibacterium baixiangningiae]
MNPANLSSAAPTTHSAEQPTDRHLKIINLELPEQDSPRYDVMMRLCRPLTSFEIHELIEHRSIGLEVSPDDPSQLIATHTTIEEVRDRLPEFHELLSAAATDAHAAQDVATRKEETHNTEEARRQLLVGDINASLGACSHTHDPA